MLAIIALAVLAIVALIVLSAAVHILFSPWVLLLGIAILAWIKFRPGRSHQYPQYPGWWPGKTQAVRPIEVLFYRTGRVLLVLPWPVPRPDMSPVRCAVRMGTV